MSKVFFLNQDLRKKNPESSMLFTIARSYRREEASLKEPLPFSGKDIWNAYELSWLNPQGKLQTAVAQISFPCNSPFIIESKSLKFYLHSSKQHLFFFHRRPNKSDRKRPLPKG